MKKLRNLVLIMVVMFATNDLLAVPIQGAGKYKGIVNNAQGGRTIKCGWQWWQVCWGVDDFGRFWVDNWGVLIGRFPLVSSSNDDTNTIPDDGSDGNVSWQMIEHFFEGMTVGSFHNAETGEMESWYYFPNLILEP